MTAVAYPSFVLNITLNVCLHLYIFQHFSLFSINRCLPRSSRNNLTKLLLKAWPRWQSETHRFHKAQLYQDCNSNQHRYLHSCYSYRMRKNCTRMIIQALLIIRFPSTPSLHIRSVSEEWLEYFFTLLTVSLTSLIYTTSSESFHGMLGSNCSLSLDSLIAE